MRNAGDGWKNGNLIDSGNVLLDFSRVEGDTEAGSVMVTSSAKDAGEALPCADILNALASGGKIDTDGAGLPDGKDFALVPAVSVPAVAPVKGATV